MKDWKLKILLLQCLSTQHLNLTTMDPITITINPPIVEEEEAKITEVEEEVSHLITSHKDLVQEQKGLLARFLRLDT